MIKFISSCVVIFFSTSLIAQTKTTIKPKPVVAATPAPTTPVTAKVVNNAVLPAKINGTITLATPAGTTAQANGIKCGAIVVTVDTSIRVAPTYSYLSVDFTGITGSMQVEILSGNNIFWVFDKAGKEVIIKEKFLKKISGSMESSTVNMLAKIPFRLKTDKNTYTIHYRWESKDKSKNLDLITSK
jgi:hypothetical protein